MKRKLISIRFFLLLCFSTVLLITGVAYSVLKQQTKIYGTATLSPKEETIQGYLVTYVIEDSWFSNGKYYYSFTFTLFNNTETLLDGWTIHLKAPENASIVNYSNVQCQLKPSVIEFSNVSYNAQVPAKKSVAFELQLSTTDPYYTPSDIVVNGNIIFPPSPPEPPEEQQRHVEIRFEQDNSWSDTLYTYYQYTTVIENTGTTAITSWQFDLLFAKETLVEQIWNAQVSQQNKTLSFQNSLYNGMIQPNSSIRFGFILKTLEETITLEPINIILK